MTAILQEPPLVPQTPHTNSVDDCHLVERKTIVAALRAKVDDAALRKAGKSARQK